MLFDKATAIRAIKLPMTSKDQRRNADIELALGAALDELSLMLRSKSFLRSYTSTATADDRDFTARGDNDDLRSIFAVKMGSAADFRVLEYIDPQQFLRDNDSGDATSANPSGFTQVTSSEGYPIIRFNVPPLTAESLTIYYYADFTPDNISMARSISAVVAGAQAYFYGIASDIGAGYHSQFRRLAILSRAADTFMPHAPIQFELSRQDKTILRTRRSDRK